MEEVTDSGFLGTTPTLACSRLGDDALIQVCLFCSKRSSSAILFAYIIIQVYPEGIRHIRADKRVHEWRTPGKKFITRCALNERQVVISLTGGEIVYFEMDQVCTVKDLPGFIQLCIVISVLEWPVE